MKIAITTRLRTLRVLVALVVTAAFGGGQLLEAVHQLVVDHEVCAHGELVHSHDGHDEHGGEMVAPLAPVQQVPAGDFLATITPGDAKAGHHAHCDDTLGSAGETGVAPTPHAPVTLTLRAALQQGRSLPSAASKAARYALAPKTSPPAART